jgi:hypothetical protein
MPLVWDSSVALCNQFVHALEIDRSHFAHLEAPDTEQ